LLALAAKYIGVSGTDIALIYFPLISSGFFLLTLFLVFVEKEAGSKNKPDSKVMKLKESGTKVG
jgi:hypothetical protein